MEEKIMARGRIFWGFLILIIGVLLLLANLEIIDYSAKRMISHIWPAALIILGLYILTLYFRGHGQCGDIVINVSGDRFSRMGSKFERTFGDIRIEAKDMEIDGLSSSMVFGDTKIDLTGGRLKSGVNRVTVSSVFGDIKILVPPGVEAAATVSNTFGDIDALGKSAEGIGNSLRSQTAGYDSASIKIDIDVRTTFGDIRVAREQ
jgi:lia operon protein LiaF